MSGCGTYVPEIQELTSDQAESQKLTTAITRSVFCELRNSVSYVIGRDKAFGAVNGLRNAAWFDKWGVQISLTLSVAEESAINPNAIWSPRGSPGNIFSLGSSIDLTSTATRISIINSFYLVKDLYAKGPCAANDNVEAPDGSFLIQSDLKLRSWLSTHINASGKGSINVPDGTDTPLQQDAVSHQVKFQVVSGGTVNPSWVLTEASVNTGAPLLKLSRDRTHDLLMTFGPTDVKGKQLIGSAAGTFFASQIGTALNNRVFPR